MYDGVHHPSISAAVSVMSGRADSVILVCLGERAHRRGDAHTLSSELRDHEVFERGGVLKVCACFGTIFRLNSAVCLQTLVLTSEKPRLSGVEDVK